jgi:hypothetical protein
VTARVVRSGLVTLSPVELRFRGAKHPVRDTLSGPMSCGSFAHRLHASTPDPGTVALRNRPVRSLP